MKVIIRYRGMVLVEKDLMPGEYTIGRAADNSIRLPLDFISRKHAKILFRDGEWWYEDLRTKHPHFKKDPIKIPGNAKVDIEGQVELITESFLDESETLEIGRYFNDGEKEKSKSNLRTFALLTIICLILMTGGGVYYFYKMYNRPMDAKAIYNFVRPKVVEFVKKRDPKAIRDLKEYVGLKDKDLRDEIGFCTGFIVAPGIVLTANHCLHGSALIDTDIRFSLKTHDGKLHEVKRILGFDVKNDYLFLDVPSLKEYGYLKIRSEQCQVGEKVYTIGNVSGEGIAIREGIMASKTKDRNDPNVEWIRYSAAASPGNSGGPLLDGFGKVIALVFAATWAENYNLGTGCDVLLDGKNRYVNNQDSKIVRANTMSLLNYHPSTLPRKLSLPVEAFYEHPYLMQLLADIDVEVGIPADLSTHYDELIEALNKATCRKFEQVRTEMGEKGLALDHWEFQSNETTPIIIPYQTDFLELYVKSEKGGRLIPETMAVLSPMDPYSYEEFRETLKKESRYEYRATSQPMKLNTDLQLDEGSYSFVYRSGDAGHKDFLDPYSNIPICQYLGRHDAKNGVWDSVRHVSSKTILKVLTGKGLLCTSRNSPYVRPNAKRMFTITDFHEQIAESALEDSLGRSWKVLSFKVFGNTTVDNYCLPLPQGVACITVFYPTTSDSLLRVQRENYARHKLSSMLISPIFWNVNALNDYYEKGLAGNLPLLKDIDFKKLEKGAISVTLKTLGLKFSIPKSKAPESIRFITGMYFNRGKKKWMGLGFEGLHSDKKKWKISGVGIEIKGSNASSILDRIREERESKRELRDRLGESRSEKHDKGLQVWQKEIRSKRNNVDVIVFGYSAPMAKHGQSDKLMKADFYSTKPFKIDYKLLEQ